MTRSVSLSWIFQTADTGTDLTEGEWQHIALTYDPASGDLKVYKNGDLSSFISDTGNAHDPSNARSPLLIGDDTSGVSWGPDEFDGKIDDLDIFMNDVLSPSEITQLYNDGNTLDLTP